MGRKQNGREQSKINWKWVKILYTAKTNGRNVVRIILDETMKMKIMKVIRKSDRTIVITFVLEASRVSVISVHAQQVGCVDEEMHFDGTWMTSCKRYRK